MFPVNTINTTENKETIPLTTHGKTNFLHEWKKIWDTQNIYKIRIYTLAFWTFLHTLNECIFHNSENAHLCLVGETEI